LSINDLKGQFKGMLKERTFNIVLINKEGKSQKGIIKYTGKKQSLKL
jgi:hypothetical protein